MRVVVQRVSEASVKIDGDVSGAIGAGLLVLLGIEDADTQADVDWLVGKLVKMRIFSDDEGKMNRSLQDIGGGLLVVSQFTLHASTKKGNRPSFIKAARPDHAIPLYESFIATAQKELETEVQSGEFGAEMAVSLVNDGPVTITIDSQAKE
ncbi:D-aminoacyl-tRNA deacylase [Sulfuriroseicoccus oceanibius]|uniref:D-aminoacyl-tRNA deacylase n=1 Tax=Sulfuriroseicoccus oceanibius TaxID=2707525 RepID=A0A6B3L7A0_9BACT|nr:D-aminoacyl-tRNA deacylase [Sulfuriroseicoccus oceanibius]QQL45452.1 D-tyrosyl-tRNA(Tyr) deacylase [Sulfuriroseicoccus oceanibius]